MDIERTAISTTQGKAAEHAAPVARRSPVATVPAALTARDRALLRAVAAGRCDLVGGAAPEMRVDGRWYCDQARAHDLVAAGLLTALRATDRGRGPAALTVAGRCALAR